MPPPTVQHASLDSTHLCLYSAACLPPLARQPVAQPVGVADVHHVIALLGVKLLDGERDVGLLAVDDLPGGGGMGSVAVEVLDGA